MIWQYDYCAAQYIRGAGNRAKWTKLEWDRKRLEPQFLMSNLSFKRRPKARHEFKVSVRRISNATNERTIVAAIVIPAPCGDKASIVDPGTIACRLSVVLMLNSVAFDFMARFRVPSTQVDYHVREELALLQRVRHFVQWPILQSSSSLSLAGESFAGVWDALLNEIPGVTSVQLPWRRLWALTPHERLRLRCILDAVVAHLYGLDEDNFRWILRDCDHPLELSINKAFTRALDPKGFWRVDKTVEPELRHTVLAQVAFHDLKEKGQGNSRSARS